MSLDSEKDYRELLAWLIKKKKFSTYDLLSCTFTKVQIFGHPFSPGERSQNAISIYLYADGTWKLE